MCLRFSGLSRPRRASVAAVGLFIGLFMAGPAQAPAAPAAQYRTTMPIAALDTVDRPSGAARSGLAVGRRTASASVVGSLISRLLTRIGFRGSRIVRDAAVRAVRREVSGWTRQQLVNWYCWSWYRYFGYNFNSWAYYARYYANPRWAWQFCDAYWQ